MPTKRKLTTLILIFTIAISTFIIGQSSIAFAAEPSKLKITIGPSNIPADNSTYQCIFVELQDSSSRPARAAQDTVISLSSSLTTVGNADSTVTISRGNTFAIASFKTTFTPGTTTIAAAASGFDTVQTSLTTVGPVPSKLALFGFPAVVPSDGISYDALVVQLQDSSGNPAKAPIEGITVTLYSSNSTIAAVPSSTMILGGQTYALATVLSSSPGSATITAMASGYTSIQTSITTQEPSNTAPKSLRIYVAPTRTLADNMERSLLLVQLLNGTGKITQAATPINVQLTSSNDNIGTVQPVVEIPVGSVYAVATFTTTYKAGVTTITAGATDITVDTDTITTVGPVPSKLAVYCTPSAVPADNTAYNTIEVQLQDGSGKPALDPDGDVTVSLFSSDPTVGSVPATLTIPYGKTYATATFTSTYIAKSTTITAQASGYTTGTATMKTYLIDQAAMGVACTAEPATVVSGKQTNVTVYVTDPGTNPIVGATVKFTSSAGGTFTAVKPLEAGYYTTIFTVPNFNNLTEVTVTASVSKTDYANSEGTIKVKVVSSILSGPMKLCVKNDEGQPISAVTVSAISKPAGMANLTGITNSTGYVTFANAMEGNYTFTLEKEGYVSTNASISFKTNSTARTLFLTESVESNQPGPDLTVVWVTVVVIAISVVGVLLFLRERKKKANKFIIPKKPMPSPVKGRS